MFKVLTEELKVDIFNLFCLIKLSKLFFSAQECVHKGKTYQNGDSFPDDCNTCNCVDGAAQCTEIACPPSDSAQQCVYKGKIIQDGDRFKAGCNTCRCRRGKIGGCTKKFCGGCQTNIDCAKAGSN